MRIVKNIMKKKIIIISIFIAFLLAIIIFCGMKSFAGANTVINEEKMVRMVASLSRAKDSNNAVNTSVLQTELNKYVGSGLTTITDGTDVITVTFTETGNSYQIYKNPTNTITYNANGGIGTVPNTQTKQYGHRIQVANSRLTKPNFSFKGWSRDSSATIATYKTGEYYIDNSNATLYAVWGADELVLYDNGVFCEESGPMIKNVGWGDFETNYNDTNKDDTCVYFYQHTSDGYAAGRFATTNPIDVTAYDKITITYRYKAEYSDAGIYGTCLFGLSETPTPDVSGKSSAGKNFRDSCVAYAGKSWSSSSGGTIQTTEIDISDVSGSYYFTWFLQNYNESVYGYLYSVVLSQDEKEGDGDYLWNYGNVYGLADLSEWDTYAHDTEESHSGNKPTMDAQGRLGVYHRGADDQTTVCPTPIDVTDYATITFVLDAVSGNTYGRVGLMAGSDARYSGFSYSKNIGTVLSEGFTPRTFTVDISDATGEYYLGFRGNKGGMTYYSQVYLSKEWPTRTITYNANGGTGAPPVQYKQIERETTLTTEEPTREGYYFLGWSTDRNATVPTYMPGENFTEDENTILYAVWWKLEELAVLNNGVFDASAGGWSAGSISDNNLVFNGTAGSNIVHKTNNAINISNYATLTVTFNNYSTGTSRIPRFGIFDASNNEVKVINIEKIESMATYVIDVSNVSGNYYIGLKQDASTSYDWSYSIKSIILKPANEASNTIFENGTFASTAYGWSAGYISSGNIIFNGSISETTAVHKTNTSVDLTNYNTLNIVLDNYSIGSSQTRQIGIFDSANTAIKVVETTTSTTATTYTIDVSSLSGHYYIGLSQSAGGTYDWSYSIKSIKLN